MADSGVLLSNAADGPDRGLSGVCCISVFDDGRSAAWAGATLAGCPYGEPLLAAAWACGWRAGQAERRHA